MLEQSVIIVLTALNVAAYDGVRNARHFTNLWVAHIPGGPEEAQLVATKFGYDYDGEVRNSIKYDRLFAAFVSVD